MTPTPTPGPARNVPVLVLKLVFPVATAFLLSWHSLSDLDIWFHLRAGRDLLEGAGLLRTNAYSFTEPGHPWLNHEWLFQVIVAPLGPAVGQRVLDVFSWNLLRTGLVLIMTLVLVGNDLRSSRTRNEAWLVWPTLVGLFLMWPRLALRPELVSYALLVWIVPLIEGITLNGSTDRTGRFPLNRTGSKILLITWIWAQFHGFASLVPALVLLAWITGTIQSRWNGPRAGTVGKGPDHRQLTRLFPLLLLALTVTPNGWRGLVFPLRAIGQFQGEGSDLQNTISELVPLMDTPNALYVTQWVFVVSLFWAAGWVLVTWGKTPLFRVAIWILAAVAAGASQRSIGIYGLAFVLLHQGYHGLRLPRHLRAAVADRAIFRKTVTTLSLLLLLIWPLLVWPAVVSNRFYLGEGADRRFGSGLTPGRFPGEMVPRLQSVPAGRFFANLDCADYLLATTAHAVYIDGRTEAYSLNLWEEYRQVKNAGAAALAILARRKVDGVCLTTAGGAFEQLNRSLLASPSWELVGADEAVLWFRPAAVDPDTEVSGALSAEENQALLTAYQQLTERADEPDLESTRRSDLYLSAAVLADFAGRQDLQRMALDRGLQVRSDHPVLNHNLGNLLMARQDWAAALPRFEAALARNRALSGSALNAGVCQMRLGRVDEAIDSFKVSLRIQKDQFQAWANLGFAYLQQGDHEKATRALERALALNPGDARLRKVLRDLR